MKECLKEYESHSRLRRGTIIICRCDEKYKTELTNHSSYVTIKTLQERRRLDSHSHKIKLG